MVFLQIHICWYARFLGFLRVFRHFHQAVRSGDMHTCFSKWGCVAKRYLRVSLRNYPFASSSIQSVFGSFLSDHILLVRFPLQLFVRSFLVSSYTVKKSSSFEVIWVNFDSRSSRENWDGHCFTLFIRVFLKSSRVRCRVHFFIAGGRALDNCRRFFFRWQNLIPLLARLFFFYYVECCSRRIFTILSGDKIVFFFDLTGWILN